MRDVVIVSAARTAIGNFNGSLSNFSAVELGVIAAREAINRMMSCFDRGKIKKRLTYWWLLFPN